MEKVMAAPALFINGVFDGVLEEILRTQVEQPRRTLFLQPYSSFTIKMLKEGQPTEDSPIKLYISTTDKLNVVSYSADIVKWEDKTQLLSERRREVEEILRTYQEKEKDDTGEFLFDGATGEGKSRNLLSVQWLVRLAVPFSVQNLIKQSDGKPLSTNRSRSGGWSTVVRQEMTTETATGMLDVHPELRPRVDTDLESGNPDTAKDRTLVSIVQRQGQGPFREKLIEAYGGRCALTGFDAVEALEACHIRPYESRKSNTADNGLLLRADLHTLFDQHLIALDADYRAVLAPRLLETSYGSLHGITLRMPARQDMRPNKELLERHRREADL